MIQFLLQYRKLKIDECLVEIRDTSIFTSFRSLNVQTENKLVKFLLDYLQLLFH